jgi:thiol-disulfide isomerase/thioredoxin
LKTLLCAALLLAATTPPTHAQQTDADALKLLDAVSAHYRDAQYLHLEADETVVEAAPHQQSTRSGVYSAWLAPGGRLRYAGEDQSGSAEIVSDGTSEWRQMNSYAAYAKAPAGTFFGSPLLGMGDNFSIMTARGLPSMLKTLGSSLHAAHFAPDETITITGKAIPCAVVQYGTPDFNSKPEYDDLYTATRVWIDRATLTVRKMEYKNHTAFYFGSSIPQHAPRRDYITTTMFTVVDLNFEPAPDTFVFHPAAGIKEVAELPTGMPGDASKSHSGLTRGERAQNRNLGKPLPNITLKDTEGKDVALSSFRGHPVLISLWATWCFPCMEELPMLDHIRKSTAGTDLQMISIDEDFHPEDAANLLHRRGYNWQDFAFNKDVAGTLDSGAIPQLVLADASGTITYYSIDLPKAQELAAAIAKLGPAYAGVNTGQ